MTTEDRMANLMGGLPQNRNVDWDAVMPVIEFEFSVNPDPVKARKENIKRAKKTLKPTKRLTGFFGYRYSGTPFRCVITGVDCRQMDYGDLFNQYFRDPSTMQPRPFRPWTGVLEGSGRQLNGTYCPQAMQLYHLLQEWLEQEAQENERGFFKAMKKKGVKFVPIKKGPKKEEHPLIVKWTPAFIEAQRDGLPIIHYKNPVTGDNDITMIVFDNRILANTMPQNTTLGSNMSVEQYYKMVENAAKEESVQ
jgi:hypothetical protein